jgi:hypothetical protein
MKLYDQLTNMMNRGGRLRSVTKGAILEEMLRVFAGQLAYGTDASAYQLGTDLGSAGWPDHAEYLAAKEAFLRALHEFHSPGFPAGATPEE